MFAAVGKTYTNAFAMFTQMYTCMTDVPSLANINDNWFGQLLDAEGRVGIAEQVALFVLVHDGICGWKRWHYWKFLGVL